MPILQHIFQPHSPFPHPEVTRGWALGLVHMNPGPCSYHGWRHIRTIPRFQIESGKISGIEAIELGPAGNNPWRFQ
jgi:hypothetical protein